MKQRNSRDLQLLGAKIIKGDILNFHRLNKTIQKVPTIIGEECTYIFHLAVQAGVRYSTINPEKTLRINVEGTSNVIKAAQKNQIQRLIVTSSSFVFGSQKYLLINEAHPKNPRSYYGASKLATENLVKVTRHLYPDQEITVIRPFTVVGARQRPDMAINIFISRAMQEETIQIFGDGTQTRDWTHVDNMAQAFYLAAIKEKAKNETFNIGTGTRISVNQVLAMIQEYTEKELKINYTDFDKTDVKDTYAHIAKAKRLLNYYPKKTIEDAIQDFTNYWPSDHYNKSVKLKTNIITPIIS
ncbi:MAG: NAD-dependent epimerase/dehydratase family protein [Candidatus Heimdallarchaeota archaeon]|nr:NAD-dependent epimerase/dehydratase family protein [Candidatus Heimdallarchaeota archaeon]